MMDITYSPKAALFSLEETMATSSPDRPSGRRGGGRLGHMLGFTRKPEENSNKAYSSLRAGSRIAAATTTTTVSDSSSLRDIKVKIMQKNPAIYEIFKERLVAKHYTHFSACYVLDDFLNKTLRIPELRDDIAAHRWEDGAGSSTTRSSSRGGLLAYLKGESSTPSPSQTKKRIIRMSASSPSSSETHSPAIAEDDASSPSLVKTTLLGSPNSPTVTEETLCDNDYGDLEQEGLCIPLLDNNMSAMSSDCLTCTREKVEI